MGAPPKTAVFDDHFHLDPVNGAYMGSVDEFVKAGGTHFLLVHKPDFDKLSTTVEAYREELRRTVEMGKAVNARGDVECFVALCPHPAEFTRHGERLGFEGAWALITGAIDACVSIAKEEPLVVALSEAGRPHYPVSEDMWAFSNRLMGYEFEAARDAGLAVQLHTESATVEVMKDLAERVEKAGLRRDRVAKHYCGPLVKDEENFGLMPSVLASRPNVKVALEKGTRFMLETDFIDDRRRPGAVMAPATVPRRTRAMLEAGVPEAAVWQIHKENPEKVYGVTIEI